MHTILHQNGQNYIPLSTTTTISNPLFDVIFQLSPYLLSFKPDENKETLIKCIESARSFTKDPKVYAVYNKFCQALKESEIEFQKYADAKWDAKEIPYTVLKPKYNAVSILI